MTELDIALTISVSKEPAKEILEQHEAEMVAFAEWVNETYTLFMEYPKQTYVNRVDANRNPFGANLLPRHTTTDLLTLFKNRKNKDENS